MDTKKINNSLKDNGFNVRPKYKGCTVQELKEICQQERLTYSVGILNLTGELNIGSIIRTSSVFGAREVLIFGRKKFDRRSLVGAQNYIPISFFKALDSSFSFQNKDIHDILIKGDYFPIFVEITNDAKQISSPTLWSRLIIPQIPKTPCLIFGSESHGIPEELISYFAISSPNNYAIVRIPQKGVLRSLNVSVAAGIVIFDMCKSLNWL